MKKHIWRDFLPSVLMAWAALGGATYLLYLWSPLAAMLWGAACLLMHYYHQYQLLVWAQNNQFTSEGFGTWGRVFRQIARQSRKKEQLIASQKERIDNLDRSLYLLPDGVAIVDQYFCLEWCNAVFAQHLGVRAAQDLGIRITHLARHPDLVNYLQAHAFTNALEFSFYGRELMLAVIDLDAGKHIIVTQDRSAQKNLETLRRDFIANSSHELRTPLTVIHGFLALAMQAENLPVLTANLPLLYRESERMMRLIEDMQNLSQLEKVGSAALESNEVCALKNLVTQVVAGAEQIASTANASYRFALGGPDVGLRVAEVRLHSVINNLVINAVRYSPQGGAITITWTLGASGLCLSVSDQGLGIAPHHIARLTERFYRVDEGYSRQVQGTGLGLAIVKHTMQGVNGRLEIDSVVGQGSCFRLYFPLERVVSDWQGELLEISEDKK